MIRGFNPIVQWIRQLVVGTAVQPSGDGDVSASGGFNLGAGTGATPGQIVANNSQNSALTSTFTNANVGSGASARIQCVTDVVTAILYAISSAGGAVGLFRVVGGSMDLHCDSSFITVTPNAVERSRWTANGALLVGKTAAAGTDAAGNVEINSNLRLSTSQLWSVGTALPATTGTMTATMDGTVKTITPTGACTFNATGGVTGQTCSFVITTSGVSSFTLTWGTAFKTTSTLATGTSSGKVFTVSFIYDGTNWNETARTTAM